jgi:hypothetical protein
MNKSETINELAAALAKFQAEVTPAPFNKVNPFLKNKYATLGSIIDTAKPVMKKHGLSVTQLVTGSGGDVGIETVLLHNSGQWISSEYTMPSGTEKGKSAAQVAGSIVTYLRRYALAAILGIYSDEDTDGNGNTKQEQREKKREVIKEELGYGEPGQERTWKGPIVTAIKKAYPDKNSHAIVQALNKSNLPDPCTSVQALGWYELYTVARGDGKDSNKAAAFVNQKG